VGQTRDPRHNKNLSVKELHSGRTDGNSESNVAYL